MALKERLDQDMKQAMRDKAQLKLDTIRMLKSAIKYREIELKKPLDDAGIEGVIATHPMWSETTNRNWSRSVSLSRRSMAAVLEARYSATGIQIEVASESIPPG